jgi:multidrug efflux pump subunit AcrA (membrane-fusion protein)
MRIFTINRSWMAPALIGTLSLGMMQTAWAQGVLIGALVSGQVTDVKVSEGDTVAANSVLMQIDAEPYRAKLAFLQANVKYKSAQYADAKIELEQQLDLFDRTVTARRTLDAAQLAYDVAQADLQKAEAELQMTQAWSKYYTVRAPFAAKVVKVHAPMGSTVYKENNPLIELEPHATQ